MKTKEMCFKMGLFTLLLIFILPVHGNTMKETERTFSKEISVKPSSLITFDNKNGPLEVNTWDKNTVKIDTRIVIDGSDEDIQKVFEYVKTMNFKQSGDNVSFNTNLYSLLRGTIPGNFKVTLNNGTVVKLTKLELNYTLTVPQNNPLTIVNAYEKVTLPDLGGKLTLDLYESTLKAGKISNHSSITLKYGKAEIDSIQDAVLSLFEAKMYIAGTGNLKIKSMYSTIEIQSAGKLEMDSYEDKIIFSSHADVNLDAKYSRVTLSDFDKGTFDLFECELRAGNANILVIGAKYSELFFSSSRAVVFTDAYETKFNSPYVEDLKASSKYSSFSLNQLAGNLTFLSSYEDNILVKEVSNKFTGISLRGKYTDIDLTFSPGAQYKLLVDLKYTDLDFPRQQFKESRYHKEDETFIYSGVIQGADENTCPVIDLIMYEGKVGIK